MCSLYNEKTTPCIRELSGEILARGGVACGSFGYDAITSIG